MSTSFKNVLVATAIAAVLDVAAWVGLHETVTPPDVTGRVDSFSYNFAPPEELQQELSPERRKQVESDFALLSHFTDTVRLYGSSGANSEIPALARKYGLRVTAGAWVQKEVQKDAQKDADFSRAEVEAAIRMANRNRNVRSIVVGNETILRKEMTVEALVALLRQVRRNVSVPVSTGETWDIWLKFPELVNEVDFIAAHVLPYWEGIPPEQAVDYALDRYNDLRRAFPGKKVVIAEFGWPSRGYNYKSAEAGPMLQADVIRQFLAEANRRGIRYNVIEAVDQTWKVREGSVGAYWGLFDADRKPKFALNGLVEQRNYWFRAGLAVALGTAIGILGLWRRRPTLGQATAFAVAAHVLSAGIAVAALYPVENYLNPGSAVAWGIGFALMVPLTLMTLVKIGEVAEVTLGRRPGRLLPAPMPVPLGFHWPKVSIHVPAYREPPEMLNQTLDALARLDYPDYEVLVVVNNTPEEAFWHPVEAHCRLLGPRFKFVLLPQVAGFKAGALNAAMAHMAPEAEIIALLDSDYAVDPGWLRDLVPAFADPGVGLVQAPQDHRDGDRSLFKTVMNSEYAGFFDIGMVQRNEDDAIIAHGTMLLVRRAAFDKVGRWSTATITEDTELGLRLLEAGYRAHYTNRRYGWGLLPDTYQAFKTQRHRWAYGAVQIIRKHWRHMLPGAPSLTSAQKFQFVAGWSYWIADAFGVLAALLNLLWVPMILFVGVLIPPLPFTLPVLAAFSVGILHCVLLYGVRVRIRPDRIVGAAVAAMSLQLTVARAVVTGFAKSDLAFHRTDKGGRAKRPRKVHPARAERILGVLIALGAATLFLTNFNEVMEIKLFAVTLAVQSLPFLAAPLMYGLERRAERAPTSKPAPIPVTTAQGQLAEPAVGATAAMAPTVLGGAAIVPTAVARDAALILDRLGVEPPHPGPRLGEGLPPPVPIPGHDGLHLGA